MANIVFDTKEFERAMEKFPAFPKEAKQAMRETLNRAINQVKTGITNEVAVDYAIKKNQVKKTIGIKRANMGFLQAEATVMDSRIKMGSFKFKYEKNRYRSPVSVKIKNSGGFKTSTSSPALFQARNQIYHRTPNDPTFKIGWAFTLSVPQMVSNDEVYRRIAEDAHAYVLRRFPEALEYRMLHRLGLK